MIAYPAIIEYSENENIFNVKFTDLPGCFTYGETLEDAKVMAKEALTGYLQSIDLRHMRIPDPSGVKGKNIYYIEPETPALS